MRTVLTIVAMIIFLWVIAFSFAVRNVMAWERIEIMHDESFLSAKPVECTFDKEMIEAHIKRMGEVPLGTAKTVMSNGTDVFDVEVRFYANFDVISVPATISIPVVDKSPNEYPKLCAAPNTDFSMSSKKSI